MISYRQSDWQDYMDVESAKAKADAMTGPQAIDYVSNGNLDPYILHHLVTGPGSKTNTFWELVVLHKILLPETLRYMWDNSDYKYPREIFRKMIKHPNTPEDVKKELQEALKS